MSLIPGSYARAAGLQSEINKVTITRVANNEVQYRRTVDTYQRDLRFSVNQIDREQKQLRASMRRYRHKLQESRKERKEREAREKETQQRRYTSARDSRQAEKASRKYVLKLVEDPPGTCAPVLAQVGSEGQAGTEEREGHPQADDARAAKVHVEEDTEIHPDSGLPLPYLVPESPDSGMGGEIDDSSLKGETRPSKVFLLSKSKAAYFKAKRGHKGRSHLHQNQQPLHSYHRHREYDDDHDDDTQEHEDAYSVFEEGYEHRLPAINEEREYPSGGGVAVHSSKPDIGSRRSHLDPHDELSAKEYHKGCEEDKDRKRKLPGRVALKSPLLTATFLDTKSFVQPEDPEGRAEEGLEYVGKVSERDAAHVHTIIQVSRSDTELEKAEEYVGKVSERDAAHVHTIIQVSRSDTELEKAEEEAKKEKELREVDMMLAMKLAQRKQRRTADISYGDLLKVRHGNNRSTKRLFSLVDRLASKHGIVDPPPITSSTLDPRSNRKIKQRGDKSQVSSSMVRQAAVLYYMKYGSRVQDADTDALQVLPVRDASPGPHNVAQPDHIDVLARDGQVSAATEEKEEEAAHGKGVEVVILTGGQRVVARRGRGTGRIIPSLQESTETVSHVFRSSDNDAAVSLDPVHSGLVVATLRRTHDVQLTDRGRSRHPSCMTVAELSEQARKIRERTLLGVDSSSPSLQSTASPSTSDRRSRPPGRKLSPLSRSSGRTQPLPRDRPEERIDSQLRTRLREHRKSEPGGSWANAFSRLKMLHTLYDLSQHFQ